MIRFRPREYHIEFCVYGTVCDRLETMQVVSILFESIRIFKGRVGIQFITKNTERKECEK